MKNNYPPPPYAIMSAGTFGNRLSLKLKSVNTGKEFVVTGFEYKKLKTAGKMVARIP